jgi:hypothetical protein
MKNDHAEHIKWLKQSIKDVKRLQAELDREVAVTGKVKRKKKSGGGKPFNAKKPNLGHHKVAATEDF